MSNYAAFFTGQKDAAAPAATAAAERPRYRILFVDDEPSILKALTRIFRAESYEILTAGSGAEALARLKEAPVQVIISDYMMPGMNGADLVKAIRAIPPYENILVVLISGAPEAALRRYNVKYDAFLRKPFGLELFLRTLRTLRRGAD